MSGRRAHRCFIIEFLSNKHKEKSLAITSFTLSEDGEPAGL
jgi:hypothetical protein